MQESAFVLCPHCPAIVTTSIIVFVITQLFISLAFLTRDVTGGYTAGPQELIDLLRNRSRPYLFSNTLPPAVVAVASKVTYP